MNHHRRQAVALTAVSLCLCGFLLPPPSPIVRAFGDNVFWMTAEDMVYTIGTTTEKIIVPKGFVTDFASIPQPLWSFGLSPQGQYSRAAVIHDYLYWTQGCTRVQSDRLLLIAMKESGVGGFSEALIFQGVRKGGAGAWRDDTKERNQGLPRIVPAQYLKPDDPNIHWDAYRQFLIIKGVHDPAFPANPSYCKFGDSTKVPGKTSG